MTRHDPILVVDDEVQIRRLLEMTLKAEGYSVQSASSAGEGLRLAASIHPSMILLDLGLPDMDGTEVLDRLREWTSVPVIILSVRTDEQEIVQALDKGADDYLTKPFGTAELLARVRTAIRHAGEAPVSEPVLRMGALSVDLDAHIVRKGDEEVKLTPKEYSLLLLFMRNTGKVLTHRYILREIWGPAFEEETQYTRIYVGQLRKKLEVNPTTPAFFLTASGIGYRFSPGEG